MTASVNIIGNGANRVALVTDRGELVVAPISYSTPYNVSIIASATEYEVVKGLSGKRFVITGLLIATNKDYASATTPALLEIYQAHPSDLATSTATFLDLDMLKNDRFSETGLNIIIEETSSLVVVAADTIVSVTIAGYYVDVL